MAKLPAFSSGLCFIFVVLFAHSWAEDPIKIHIFLHSHLDEGWIYTFDRYYTGPGTQDGGCVSCIFNNVYRSLLSNPGRKYQLAEVAFFNRWWSEQSQNVKDQFRKLLQQKQVEFINGGWSANDEACAYYEDIIDQFILGHRYLKKEFDLDPAVGWQIDSFGHSATHAALMAQAGYDGLFFGRIDFQDWEQRRREKTLEVNWKTQNPHNESIFTHVLYVHYSDTKFFVNDNYNCRSIFCYGRLSQNGLDKVEGWIKQQSNSFKTKNIAMLVGDDFHLWKGAEQDFDGIEAMIKYFDDNPQKGIKAKFSTLSEYVDEFKRDYLSDPNHQPLPEKHGDFFPYIENEWTSWVGYYTSKSMFKLKVREVSQYYNAAKVLLAKFMLLNDPNILRLDASTLSNLNSALFNLENPLGVVQHHDAISGTMREYVKQDYQRMLDAGKRSVEERITPVLKSYSEALVRDTLDYNFIDFDWRQNDPLMYKIFEQGKKVLVNVFNPGEKDKFLVKIRVPGYKYKVLDETNNYVLVDIMCHSRDANPQDCFIYFVEEIPAYSLKTYILVPSTLSKRIVPKEIYENIDLYIGNQVTLTVDSNLMDFSYRLCPFRDPSDLSAMFTEQKCIEDTFNLNYEYYESHLGSGLYVSSGAYIFNPRSENKQVFSPIAMGRVLQGRHLTIVQVFRDDVRTDLKFVHHELDKGIEIESYLEPVRHAPNGKEIVIMIRSKNILNQDHAFYTDDNGYYMQKRVLNHRDDFTSRTSVPIPSNYYPITSAFYIENSKNVRVTIMTDRAQGVTSLQPGEMEIMIHRLTLRDDWKGLSETLQEGDPDGSGPLKVSTRHYLIYSSPANGFNHQQRTKQYKLDRPLQFWFANTNVDKFENPLQNIPSSLELPCGIKLYVRSYDLNEYIVRIHNLDEEASKVVEIYNLESKLCTLLNNFSGRTDIKIASINELSLFTTKDKNQVKKNELDSQVQDIKNPKDGADLSTVELVPMEIRTFKIILQQ